MKDTIESVLAEFKGLYKELGLHDKEMIIDSLCNVRDNITQAHNILEIKEAYAKENLKNTYRCVYVENSDNNNNFIIISNEFGSISKVYSGLVSFYSSEFNIRPIDMPISSFIFGATEQLAWCAAYNKLIAIDRNKL